MSHIETNRLDVNQPLVDKKGKATPYFESVMYEVIQGLINYGIDQEVGTWTPELWDDTLASDPSPPAYTRQVGTYTKQGDITHFQGRVTISSLGGLATGEGVRISLPFPSEGTADNFSAITVGFAGGINITAGVSLCGFVPPLNNYAVIGKYALSSGVNNLFFSELTSSGDLIFSGTYKANA